MKQRGQLSGELPLHDFVAATSVGRVGGHLLLDLAYDEDSAAEVDMNIVKTGRGRFVEIQGTAEKTPFTEEQFLGLLALAKKGIAKLVDLQKMAVM